MKDFGDEPLTFKTAMLAFTGLPAIACLIWLIATFIPDADAGNSINLRLILGGLLVVLAGSFTLLLRSQFKDMERNPDRPKKTAFSKEWQIGLGFFVILIGILGFIFSVAYGAASMVNFVVIGAGVRMILVRPRTFDDQ